MAQSFAALAEAVRKRREAQAAAEGTGVESPAATPAAPAAPPPSAPPSKPAPKPYVPLAPKTEAEKATVREEMIAEMKVRAKQRAAKAK